MRCWLIPLLLLTAGCKAEPDFDQRYISAEEQMRAKEQAIDAELGKRAKEAESPTLEPPPAAP